MQTKTIGIALIVLGAIMMVYTGFNYITTKNVVDLGPVQINSNEHHTVQWPPLVGMILLVSGIVVVISNKKASA
jgi:hypothetical protein